MFEWIIVGAGIHGTHLAQALLTHGGVAHQDLRIIDPHPAPLTAWRQRSSATGMRVMRSPAAHHLDMPARALVHFAHQRQATQQLQGRYRKPTLSLFNAHSEHLIQTTGLSKCLVRDSIESIQPGAAGYHLAGRTRTWQARHVVLACGPPPPCRPAWAASQPRITHVFDPGFTAHELPTDQPLCIVGGGLSAAQLALTLAARGARPTLVTRHPIKLAEFDSDPCYLGPRCLRNFQQTENLDTRRQLIRMARHPGTVPQAIYEDLQNAQRAQQLNIISGEPAGFCDNVLNLTNGQNLPAARLVLATGFSNRSGPGALVTTMANEYHLPRTSDGTPLTNDTLEWRRRLFVTGRQAELTLGPAAGNIAGARMAARRLLAYCRNHDCSC